MLLLSCDTMGRALGLYADEAYLFCRVCSACFICRSGERHSTCVWIRELLHGWFFWSRSVRDRETRHGDLGIKTSLVTGPIHTGRRTRCSTRCKEMGPINVNGGVHTARKQHQRKNVRICVRIASCVLCGLGHMTQQTGKRNRKCVKPVQEVSHR